MNTNDMLQRVLDDLDVLVCWAEADAEHSTEAAAHTQALDDKDRARMYESARHILKDAFKQL